MFKKLIIAAIGTAAAAATIGVSFSTETFTAEQPAATAEFVTVGKAVKLSNYSVELSNTVKIDDETYDVVDNSPVCITFSYDAYSAGEYTLNTNYRFNFNALADSYYVSRVEMSNHVDGDVKNGSTYYRFKEDGISWNHYGFFPKTVHDLHEGETVRINEVMKIYFTVDSNLSREDRLAKLNKYTSFVNSATVTILDAYAE